MIKLKGLSLHRTICHGCCTSRESYTISNFKQILQIFSHMEINVQWTSPTHERLHFFVELRKEWVMICEVLLMLWIFKSGNFFLVHLAHNTLQAHLQWETTCSCLQPWTKCYETSSIFSGTFKNKRHLIFAAPSPCINFSQQLYSNTSRWQ